MKKKASSLWQTTLIVDPNASIELVYTTMLINQKARNVCQLNGIYTLGSLINHYLTKGSFTDLSSCGFVTNNELVDYAKSVLKENPLPFQENLEAHPLSLRLKTINENAQQGALLIKYVQLLALTFPPRISNALSAVFADEEAVFDTKIWFLLQDKPQEINNIGNHSAEGVTAFVSRVMDFLKTLERNYSEASKQYLILIFNSLYGIEKPENFIHLYKSKIHFTPLLKEVLKTNKLTKGNQFKVLNDYLQIFTPEPATENFENFHEKINKTSERLRQIIHELPNRVRKVFAPLNDYLRVIQDELPDVFFHQESYLHITSKSLSSIPAADRGALNSKGLALYIFGLNDNYIEIYPLPESDTRHDFFLLGKELSASIKPAQTIRALRSLTQKKREQNDRLDLKSFMKNWPDESETHYLSFIHVLNALLEIEFDLKLLDGHFIELPRNSKKLQWEYALKVLEEKGAPMHLSEIFRKLQSSNPEIFSNENQLRSAILRQRDVFFSIGKSSTYGLNAWKNTSKRIKSEPIVEIVHEFLEKSDTPRHHFDVTRFVRIYRDSPELSIINILKLDEADRFKFLPGGFIGLSNKVYSKFGMRYNNHEPDTEAMIIHMVQDSGPVNKVEFINKAAGKYGLTTVQVEFIIDTALKKNLIQHVNDFLF